MDSNTDHPFSRILSMTTPESRNYKNLDIIKEEDVNDDDYTPAPTKIRFDDSISNTFEGAEAARAYSKVRPSQLVSQSSYKHMPKSTPDTDALLREIMDLEKRNCELRDEIDEDNVTLLNRRLMKLKSENSILQEKKKTHLIEHDANGVSKSQDSPRQHRRRKSIIQSSRYSLASRFSMDGSEVDVFRSSMARRTSMGALQDFDRQSLGLAINSMRLSIQKPLQDTDVSRNFLEFSMIGMNDDILAGLAPPMDSNRQQAVLLDNFPKTDISYINSIPNFAFPSNVPIVILTEYSAPHYRVTPNQYHILQFSDECGTPTYACCLTVSEKIRLTNAVAISHFEKLQQRICSMRVIVRFFRFVRQFTSKYSRSAILNKNGNIVGYVTTPRSKGGSETGEAAVAPSPSISSTLSRFKDTVTKVVSRKNTGNMSPQNNNTKPGLFSGLTRFTSDSIDSEDVSETSSRSGNSRRVSVKKSVKKKHGIVLVVQRAYCLISAQPKHSVLFKILEEMVQRESQELITIGGPKEGNQLERYYMNHTAVRNSFLEYFQNVKIEIKNKSQVLLYYPIYIQHKIALAVDQTRSQDWAYAALFSTMNSYSITNVLNLLVLEKSLVIYGANASIVTAIACAFVQLLSPFQWEGVFVPLVPFAAMEILQAPVPFIVGTVHLSRKSDISPTAAILYVDELLATDVHHRQNSYKYLHMPEISVKMPLDQNLRMIIDRTNKQLSRRLPHKTNDLQLSQFLNLTSFERRIIHDTVKTIEAHNMYLCSDVSEVDGWRKYGTYDASTGEYEFYPQWFMDHQRSILDFQEGVVKTQLFMSYMDRLRMEYIEKNCQRLFIADWIYFRHIMRKKYRSARKISRQAIILS